MLPRVRAVTFLLVEAALLPEPPTITPAGHPPVISSAFTSRSALARAAGHLSRHADEERSAHPQDDAPAASFLVGLVKLRGFHTWPGHRRRADHPHRGAAESRSHLAVSNRGAPRSIPSM